MTLVNDTETPEIDPFEAAFKELSELEAQGKEVVLNETDNAGAGGQSGHSDGSTASSEQASDDLVKDQSTGGDEVETAVSEPDTDTQVEESAVEEKPDPTENLLNKFSEIIDRATPKKQEEVKQVDQPESIPTEIYTSEENAFLKEYAKDWGDVVKGEALVRKKEYHELLNYVFNEVSGQLKPMMETLRTLAERTHLSDLQANVSDYSDVRDRVIDWVGTQPAYLQTAYNHVIQQGTVDEVKDLINRYRQETGSTTTSTPVQVKKTAKTELSPATKQAAATLAPISSKRSTVTVQGIDTSDFDSAFAMFSKEE